MIPRRAVGMAATLAMAALVGCGTGIPVTGRTSIQAVQAADPPPGVYVHIASVQDLLARTDLGPLPDNELPSADQMKTLLPARLTPEQASHVLLQIPASLVHLPGDSGSTRTSSLQPSRFGGGMGGGRGMGGGFGGGFGRGVGGGFGRAGGMVGGWGHGNGQGWGHGWGHGYGQGWGHGYGQGWGHGYGHGWGGWGPYAYGGPGYWPFGWPGYGPDGWPGLYPFDSALWGGFYPFGIFGAGYPYQGGLFPFGFYPFMYSQALLLAPYALASGVYSPFYPPFYAGQAGLYPYDGMVPPPVGGAPLPPFGGSVMPPVGAPPIPPGVAPPQMPLTQPMAQLPAVEQPMPQD